MSVWRMFVVYVNPRDYPGKVVVREHQIQPDVATPVVSARPLYVGDDVVAARDAILTECPGVVPTARHPDDDPVIREVWL